MDTVKITIVFDNQDFQFEYGSQAYIFHTGIYNDIHEKYGIKALLQYVALVQDCYLSDSNRTPLGSLADYIAENWEELKEYGRYDILEKFYSEECY